MANYHTRHSLAYAKPVSEKKGKLSTRAEECGPIHVHCICSHSDLLRGGNKVVQVKLKFSKPKDVLIFS